MRKMQMLGFGAGKRLSSKNLGSPEPKNASGVSINKESEQSSSGQQAMEKRLMEKYLGDFTAQSKQLSIIHETNIDVATQEEIDQFEKEQGSQVR